MSYLPYFITFTILLFINIMCVNIFAISPSFSRQVVDDATHDIKSPVLKNEKIYSGESDPDCLPETLPTTDIKSVSYISDGKTLNATLWLTEPFTFLPPESKGIPYGISYSMYIDVNSIYDANTDYNINYYWETDYNRTWTIETLETSKVGDKTLYSKQNPTDIAKKGQNYINFIFDLKTANYPKNYRIFFSAIPFFNNENGKNCVLMDITNYLSAPPPEFNISATPNNVELRPGEEKTVQLTIQSKTNLDAKALLWTNSTNSIIANLTSKEISILPYNIATSTLKVKALKNATVNSHVLPLSATISFPEIFEVVILSELPLNLNSNATPVIIKNFTQSISILPPFTFGQHMNNIADWVSPINSIWTFITAIGAILIPFIIRIYSKKQQKRTSLEDSY